MGGDGADDLCTLIEGATGNFAAYDSRADDLCLIAFTSGTTGEPKGTMHFHRDMLAICDGYARNVLRARPDDVFIGTAPLAFTFGLGAVVLFPLRIGASAILLEKGVARLAVAHDPNLAADYLLYRPDGLPGHVGAAAAG